MKNNLELFAVIVAFSSLITIAYTTYADHDRSKKDRAYNMLKDDAEFLFENSQNISLLFPELNKVGSPEISEESSNQIIKATDCNKPESSIGCQKRTLAYGLLNQLDLLSAAYLNGIADKEMLDNGLSKEAVRIYRYFHPVIINIKQRQNRSGWDFLEKYVNSQK